MVRHAACFSGAYAHICRPCRVECKIKPRNAPFSKTIHYCGDFYVSCLSRRQFSERSFLPEYITRTVCPRVDVQRWPINFRWHYHRVRNYIFKEYRFTFIPMTGNNDICVVVPWSGTTDHIGTVKTQRATIHCIEVRRENHICILSGGLAVLQSCYAAVKGSRSGHQAIKDSRCWREKHPVCRDRDYGYVSRISSSFG